MNPPSLDPPPDDTYPAFAVAQKDRRAIIWVGTNRGIFEGIDARLGVEVWGYIPMNLLPKLRTLWDGQAVGSTDFMMDGSPKISDIRQADGTWKTYMFSHAGRRRHVLPDVRRHAGQHGRVSIRPTIRSVTSSLTFRILIA
jgi:hypothetical protein